MAGGNWASRGPGRSETGPTDGLAVQFTQEEKGTLLSRRKRNQVHY